MHLMSWIIGLQKLKVQFLNRMKRHELLLPKFFYQQIKCSGVGKCLSERLFFTYIFTIIAIDSQRFLSKVNWVNKIFVKMIR